MTLVEEAFLDIHRGRIHPFYIQIGRKRRKEDLTYYFQGFPSFHPVEKALLGAAEGRVYDAAAGAGRMGLTLQERRIEAVCGDASSVMRRIGLERGCSDYRIEDLLAPTLPEYFFDTVVFMGNSIGFCRNKDEIAGVVKTLSDRLVPGGLLLMSATDPSVFGLEKSAFLPFVQIYKKREEKGGWFLADISLIREASSGLFTIEAMMSHEGMNGFFFRKREG